MGTCHVGRHVCVWNLIEIQCGAGQIESGAKICSSKYAVVESDCELTGSSIFNRLAHSDDVVNLLPNNFALHIRIARIKNYAFQGVFKVVKEFRKWLGVGTMGI